MVAKQILFARIPLSVKAQILNGARGRSTTVSQEIERMVLSTTTPVSQVLLNLEVQHLTTQLRTLQFGHDLLINAVQRIGEVAKDLASLDEALVKLGGVLQLLQEKREETRQEFETQRQERQAAIDAGSKTATNTYKDLVPGERVSLDKQLGPFERRRNHLLQIFSKSPRGSKTRLCQLLGWKRSSQLSQLLSLPTSHGHRTISDITAHRIEDALNLQRGVLDKLESITDGVMLSRAVDALVLTMARVKSRIG